MKTRMERMQAALEVATDALTAYKDTRIHAWADTALERIQSILSPTVEREEEVVRWAAYLADGAFVATCDTQSEAESVIDDCKGQVVKLTGTRKRTVRVVEKSVSAPAEIRHGDPYSIEGDDMCPFAPQKECHGKKGVLTFTWTEEEEQC